MSARQILKEVFTTKTWQTLSTPLTFEVTSTLETLVTPKRFGQSRSSCRPHGNQTLHEESLVTTICYSRFVSIARRTFRFVFRRRCNEEHGFTNLDRGYSTPGAMEKRRVPWTLERLWGHLGTLRILMCDQNPYPR